jgi:hypothetical protein
MRSCAVCFALLFATIFAGACRSSSSAPAAPTPAIGTPSPVSPSNGAQIANLSQPVTVTVQNATTSGATGVTYTFEVATDFAFTNKVQTKSGVPEGTTGQTSVRLDTLMAAKEYFWRAQAASGTTTAAFGGVYGFTIGAVISVGAPAPVSPLNGATTTDRPQFTISNAVKAGPTGVINYRFEVADNPGFSPLLVGITIAETGNQTSLVPAAALPTGRTLYWRATALDVTNGVTGGTSAVQSFMAANPSAASQIAAQQGVVLWPGAQPTGTTGRARMSAGWEVATRVDYLGNRFLSPTTDELRVFDLLDRGLDPDAAISWMKNNGYPTVAVYYPSVLSIGFPQQYMALIAGAWELVLRVGA